MIESEGSGLLVERRAMLLNKSHVLRMINASKSVTSWNFAVSSPCSRFHLAVRGFISLMERFLAAVNWE